MRKFILSILVVGLACVGRAGADNSITVSTGPEAQVTQADRLAKIRSFVGNIHAAKDKKEKAKYREELSKQKPASNEEIEEMFKLAEDKDDDVKTGALDSLSYNVKDPSFAPLFRKRIKNGNVLTRAIAVKKAREFKDKEAVPDLIDVADGFKGRRSARTLEEGGEMHTQIEAMEALGDIGDERAIPMLISKLGKDGDNVEIPRAVSRFGRKAFPQLLAIASNSTDKVQHRAIGDAMGRMTDKSLIPDFWKLVQEKGWFSRTLIYLTDNTTTPTQDEVIKYLEKNADKQHFGYRMDLLEFAEKKGDIQYLLKIAQDNNKDHIDRGAAIGALGRLQSKEAVPMLEDFFKHGDRGLSGSSATALERITGRKCDRDTRTYIK